MNYSKDKAEEKIRRFKKVELSNWKNFQKVDVHLTKRVFLVGPNASGKSNFLDVFRFLNDIASVGGGFQHAVKKRGGVSSFRGNFNIPDGSDTSRFFLPPSRR